MCTHLPPHRPPCPTYKQSFVLRTAVSHTWRCRARQRRAAKLVQEVRPGVLTDDGADQVDELPSVELEEDDLGTDMPGHRSGTVILA